MPHVIHLTKQNLAYVETPKVASTTMMEFMHALAGLPPTYKNPRKAARKPKVRHLLGKLGVQSFSMSPVDLAAFQMSHPNVYWIAITRDPYQRIISTYHSKLHRYAEKFDRPAFWKGTFGRFRNGIKAIDDSRYLAKHVGLHITFDEMIRGLAEYGTDFDAHFDLQTRILAHDTIRYNKLIDQQSLEEGLRKVCTHISQPYPFPEGAPRRNPSFGPERIPVNPQPHTLKLISQIYAADFRKFGYADP